MYKGKRGLQRRCYGHENRIDNVRRACCYAYGNDDMYEMKADGALRFHDRSP